MQSGESRVFLIEGRARPDHRPSYESCLRMQGVSRSFGDVERVECPDPLSYNNFVQVAEIQGAVENATTTLEGRYAREVKSTLLALANKGCSIDVQLHMGSCTDPSDFNTFDKALVLEKVRLTSYGTDELGTLQSGDRAAVNETVEISASEMYEIVNLAFARQADSIITNEILDVTVCDSKSCGECETESDGCQRIISISKSAGGSPNTSADIVYTIDQGGAWYAHDIDTLGVAEDPSAVDCLGSYLVVVSNASNSLHYVEKVYIDGVTDPVFTEVATGFVVGGEPNDIYSVGNYAFIVGDMGYVYGCQDPTAGVTVLDAGSATPDTLNAVHALSEDFAVAVGDNGTVIYTENGTSWTAVNVRPVGVAVSLNCVWVKGESEWFVGASNGNLYYTFNKGNTWTIKTFSGSGAGQVRDIVFATDSVGYLAHSTAAPSGRILRTYDGGYTWNIMPEGSGVLPVNDYVSKLGVCDDANFVAGVGLHGDGADGFIVLGQTA
jgi:photosystem II stability/assembly factor-like uncharacterized protein